jgi:hypothetical protein
MEYFPNLDRMSAEDQYAVGARRVYEADEQTVD